MHFIKPLSATVLALALGLAMPCAIAQRALPQPHLTPQQQADRATIRNFPLSMDLIRRLATTIEAGNQKHLPCASTNGGSIDATVRQITTQYPWAVPFLAKHGFTPRQFVVATFALANTVMTANFMAHPNSPWSQAALKQHGYSPRNVALFNANKAEITMLMNKMDSGSSCGN